MASTNCTPIIYAGDTTLLSIRGNFTSNPTMKSTLNQINAELIKITDWLGVNKLSLNASKTKMSFHSKQRILKNCEILYIKVNGIPVDTVTYFLFLGAIIDCDITLPSHINCIANKLSRICGTISILKHHVPVYILKIIYNSLFLSHINYVTIA